jgi:hypothetical protein
MFTPETDRSMVVEVTTTTSLLARCDRIDEEECARMQSTQVS